MRWVTFLIIGLLFTSLGIILCVLGPSTPVHYFGAGSLPSRLYEVLAPTVPNTLHLRLKGENALNVELFAPNRTRVEVWSGLEVNEDYVLNEVGIWGVYVSAPGYTNIEGSIYTTAPLTAHPALIYASGALLLGSLTLLYSIKKKRLEPSFNKVLFEQNIGGRWVFLAWLPILAFTADAPHLIPSYPWLYLLLIVVTVIAVFSCISLAYIKLYVLADEICIEAPFLNFLKHYKTNQIRGFWITKEKKRRWFLLYPLPNIRGEKEDFATISLLEPLPKKLQILVLGAKIAGNEIHFKPKSVQKLKTSMKNANISEITPAQM